MEPLTVRPDALSGFMQAYADAWADTWELIAQVGVQAAAERIAWPGGPAPDVIAARLAEIQEHRRRTQAA
jgi:hypothetical protein